jgi:hypothetical protein
MSVGLLIAVAAGFLVAATVMNARERLRRLDSRYVAFYKRHRGRWQLVCLTYATACLAYIWVVFGPKLAGLVVGIGFGAGAIMTPALLAWAAAKRRRGRRI